MNARLKLAGIDRSISVKPSDKAATFEVDLKKGDTQLQSWFTVDGDQTINAYYVYVERISL